MNQIKLVAVVMFMISSYLYGQESGQENPPAPITIRVVAIGQTPPERFKAVKFDAETRKREDDRIRSLGFDPTGGGGDGKPPPIETTSVVMLPENPEEYPPRPIYLSTSKKIKPAFLWLTPGSSGQRIALPRTRGVVMYQEDQAESPFFSRPIPETTSHLTVFMVAPPGQTSWKGFKTIEMDTSPEKIPGGSVMLINFSKTTILGNIGAKIVKVDPGGKLLIPISMSVDSRGMVSLKLQNRGTEGKIMGLTRTARRLRDTDRLFIVAYHALTPMVKGQPTMLTTFVDPAAPAKLRGSYSAQPPSPEP